MAEVMDCNDSGIQSDEDSMDCNDSGIHSGEESMDCNDDVMPSCEEVMDCNDDVISDGEEAMEATDSPGDDTVMEQAKHIIRTPDLFAMKMNELAALFSKLNV